MTAFDAGPLGWVKPEIDRALAAADDALARLAVNPDDAGLMRSAHVHLHQVSGALSMVGLEPGARVSEAVEKLLTAVESGQILLDAAQTSAARRALSGLTEYLDGLMGGAGNHPLRLYPVYRELVTATGLEQPSEVDLFYPDLSQPPPRADAIVATLGAAELTQRRGEFQRGLLNLIRNQQVPASLAAMRDALLAIEAGQPGDARAFWWIAGAFVDGLVARGEPPAGALRQLLSRLDVQIKRLAEAGVPPAERLTRELLYAIAGFPPGSEQVAEVQRVYALGDLALVAGGSGDGGAGGRLAQTVRELSAQVEGLKDHWLQLSEGTASSPKAFADLALLVAGPAAHLKSPGLAHLFETVAHVGGTLRDEGRSPDSALAMETATALLVMRDGLDNYHRLGAEFDRQSELVAARVAAALAQQPLPASGDAEVEQITRAAEEKALNAQVAQEIRVNLAAAEGVLDSYFRDPTTRDCLPRLGATLAQVQGAFAMLDRARAAQIAASVRHQVVEFAASEHPANAQDAERVAEAVSQLGLYAEAIQHHREGAEALLAPEAVQTWPAAPQPEVVEPAVQARVEIPVESSPPLDLAREASMPQAPEPVFMERGQPAHTPAKALAWGEQVPAPVQAPAETTAEATAGPQVAAGLAGFDAELLEVFREEAEEVLASIEAHIGQVRGEPANREALTVVRRGFHTLKGSGRMVGLTDLGEVAWHVEQALNKWLAEHAPASERLLQLLGDAHRAFVGWMATLRAGSAPVVEAAQLVELAEALKSGAYAAAAPGEPAPVARRAPVVIGSITLDADFFDIFAREAGQHRATLEAQMARLDANPAAPVVEAFMRAAHTLTGISGVCGFQAIADLGFALERWLQDRIDHPTALDVDEQALVGDAVEQLGRMVDRVLAQVMPTAQPDLVNALAESLEVRDAARGAPELAVPAAESMGSPSFSLPSLDLEPLIPQPEPSGHGLPSRECAAATAGAPIEAGKERRVLSDDVDEQLLPLFVEEAFDIVPEVGNLLRAWRADLNSGQFASPLGRHLHTLKGSARMAGVMRLGELAHRLENQVVALREAPEPASFDALEEGFDRFTAALERLRAGERPTATPVPEPVAAPAVVLAPARPLPVAISEDRERASLLRVRAELVDRFVNDAGEISIARSRIEGELNAFRQGLAELTDNVAKLRAQLREVEIQAESQIQSSIQHQQEVGGFDPLEFDRFTRMQELTRFMAESVNDFMTLQQSLQGNIDEIDAALTSQARLTRGLQEDLMDVRMVPLANLSDRLYRIVRQTGKELGKRANLELTGLRTELDRGVLEKVVAPFEHLLRNAVAHGIELPEAREARGKPPIGEITIDARQQSNEIILTLSDDGRGLDFARIRQKALDQGLMQPDETLTDAQLTQFIFLPGFSTAHEVSQISGRGVGMDVVRNEILGLGGRVDVESTTGLGTTFIISLPLTLAVTQAFLVHAGGRLHAIPSVMVEQVQQHKQPVMDDLRARKELTWQGNRYPFHVLSALLGEEERPAEPKRFFSVVLVKSGAQRVAIEVDDIVGNREIVVKPIGPQLSRLAGIAGATVLGNGEIVLILNPPLLAARGESGLRTPAPHPVVASEPTSQDETRAPLVMVVDDSLTVRKITSRLLTREGYKVLTAKDGVDALQQVADVMPEVMLLDIEMPRMDGFELTRNLRADPRTAGIPIIMITSRTAEKHRNFAFELGVNEYLGKPFQEEELLGLLARFTQRVAMH